MHIDSPHILSHHLLSVCRLQFFELNDGPVTIQQIAECFVEEDDSATDELIHFFANCCKGFNKLKQWIQLKLKSNGLLITRRPLLLARELIHSPPPAANCPFASFWAWLIDVENFDAMWAAEIAALESVRAANVALSDLEDAQAACRYAETDFEEEEDAALEAQIWRVALGEEYAEEAPWHVWDAATAAQAEEEMRRSSGSVGNRVTGAI